MRIRKLSALVGAVVIFGGCMVLYLMTDLTLFPLDIRENKWARIENDIKHVENEKEQVAQDVMRDSPNNFIGGPQQSNYNFLVSSLSKFSKDMVQNNASCSLRLHNIPKSDIQMLDVYSKIPFDNLDGGVWKQGWEIEYDPRLWNERKKLKVFVVPHSHNDPGWIKTFEDYYQGQTRKILNNMAQKLKEDRNRKFIWAEISYFSLWWDEIKPDLKAQVKQYLENGQLEIVTGGWVMNDEANSHYFSILQQLIEGHTWLVNQLGYKPNNSWAIDPFGHSAVMPYILKRMGFENLLIQRVHYSVKKDFARNKNLEFRWRQIWDGTGSTDLLTHMMPFYSYDVPHTCGPDPKVCCQFDFRRLPGFGLTCPWSLPPQIINDQNVASRAQMLLDQYRKKAQLFQTNVVLAPLGDDFRYDHASEWDVQFDNYQKLFDYMNRNPELHVEAQFGTLNDYFKAVRDESSFENFPSLSGDFFTYADREDHYWSGYYTSRPFYKRMDRILVYYLRAAEIIFGLAWGSKPETSGWLLAPESGHIKLLSEARQSLSLFQHHDAITGTAKNHVVEDYAKKMLSAINGLQHVIQQCVHFLLSFDKSKYQHDTEYVYFDLDDIRKYHYSLPDKTTLSFGDGLEFRKVVLFNSLTWTRKEMISIRVSTPYIKVTHSNGTEMLIQISPVFLHNGGMVDAHYDVSFIAEVPSLGLTTYFIHALLPSERLVEKFLSTVKYFNSGEIFTKVEGFEKVEIHGEAKEFSISNSHIAAAFSQQGLLKAITLKKSGITVPLHLDFARYLARQGKERSGAYLFLPDGGAEIVRVIKPKIRLIEGPLFSQVDVNLPNVFHSVKLYNTPGADSLGIEIQNEVNIIEQSNYELAMRISSNIKNGDTFYSDLNDLQMIRRKRFAKLPIQANYYPMPSAAFIEDGKLRLSILSAQPVGMASLKEGQLEFMQDRILNQDDNRGLGQGVTDNKPTPSIYRLIVEERQPGCQTVHENHPSGFLSTTTHVSSVTMNNPLLRLLLLDSPTDNLELNHATSADTSYDIHLVKLHSFLPPSPIKVGVILHRQHFDKCFIYEDLKEQKSSSGLVNIGEIFPTQFGDRLTESSLSFLHLGKTMSKFVTQSVCSMELAAYILSR